MLIEAKTSVIGDNKAGFYQLFSEMVVAQKNSATKIFGVYTDHIIWQFVLLDEKKISYSKAYQLFELSAVDNDVIFNKYILSSIGDLRHTHQCALKDSWLDDKRTLLISELP